MILCYKARNNVHDLDETLAFSILIVDWPIVWWPNVDWLIVWWANVRTGRLSENIDWPIVVMGRAIVDWPIVL